MNYGYDIETYPNVFTFSCEHVETGNRWYYEISERRNDLVGLVAFLNALRDSGANMIGFNNVHFDYPVIHFILERAAAWTNLDALAVVAFIYEKAQSIFAASNRFAHIIWRPVIRQIDLFKIHHFDNKAKSTSLKVLEFNMRSMNICDLPFPPGTYLTVDQIPTLAEYNMHDVSETLKFWRYTKTMIDFRERLTEKFGKDFTNFNDGKIGAEIFIMRLEEYAPGTCYYYDANNRRQPRQTSRPEGVSLNDVIFDYVEFRHPEFDRILTWLKSQTLSSKEIQDSSTVGVETKGVFKGVHCVVDGFKYDFGTGGIHGSVDSMSVFADDEYAIVDLDVASYYPNLAIANRIYPEHLGEMFCDIYNEIYQERKTYKKKTSENIAFKYALNVPYGQSNNAFTVFFDPKYTMSITINGQLLLCMLAEWLSYIPGLTMIQINTDGLTVKVPRIHIGQIDAISRQWERLTNLELEDVHYSAMHIRDVNSYIGVYEDGSVKLKGAYENKQPYDRVPLGWHQNMSALIVPKAAEAALVHGVDPVTFITSPERDVMDFMLRTKPPRASKLILVDDDGVEHEQQRISRYFVAHKGGSLFKVSPPTKPHTVGAFKKKNGVTDAEYFRHDPNVWNPDVHTKNQSRYKERRDGYAVGWKVEVCNDIRFANWANINHAYYIAEARKLIDCIK